MRFLPYARLLRLPNVFTAFADIAMGVCVTSTLEFGKAEVFRGISTMFLFIASGCLYLAGMVWNDYFDLEEDRRDRPFRPLASGAVSVQTAVWIGSFLMFAGLLCATLAGGANGALLGGALVAAILLYNAWLKRTPLGPLGMGACRFLNVLLGLSYADMAVVPLVWGTRLHLAAVVGLYIVGVTLFARTEEKRSNPTALKWAAVIMLAALILALAVPTQVPAGTSSLLFPYFLVVFGFAIGFPVVAAIRKPTPASVQAGVKRCILGLVALDALLATVFVGEAGLLILLLLPPALLLGKWVYST